VEQAVTAGWARPELLVLIDVWGETEASARVGNPGARKEAA
jgi:hypothetical protein